MNQLSRTKTSKSNISDLKYRQKQMQLQKRFDELLQASWKSYGELGVVMEEMSYEDMKPAMINLALSRFNEDIYKLTRLIDQHYIKDLMEIGE